MKDSLQTIGNVFTKIRFLYTNGLGGRKSYKYMIYFNKFRKL